MSAPATFKYDNLNGFVTPVQDGRTGVAYPFLQNGSTGPKVYTRNLLQREAYYTPAAMGFEQDSVHEGGDPQAYLISETSPEYTGIGDLMRFTRTYARIPATQTVYGSRVFVRPIMHDIFLSNWYAVSFDNGLTSHLITNQHAITGTNYSAATTTPVAMPGTNIVFIEGGRTLNLPANSSGATTVTNFNATLTGLTGVAANSSTGFLSIVWTGAMTSITPPAGVVITALGSWNVTFQSTGTITSPATTTFTSASHGATVGNRVALWSGNRLVATSTVIAVGDANTFSVLSDDLPSSNPGITLCGFGNSADTIYRVVNGASSGPLSVKETTVYYLPRVTPGITTPTDIPVIVSKNDPISWLTEIIAWYGGGSSSSYFVNVDGTPLERWLDGPIYSQKTIAVQMADAFETVSVSA